MSDKNSLGISLRALLIFTVTTGILYPLLITAIGKLLFPQQAMGNLVVVNGKTVGSVWISQSFKEDKNFWPRPSSGQFDGVASGGTNLGPISGTLVNAVKERETRGLTEEMRFTSGSGLDPHISPKAAKDQIERVARARGFNGHQQEELMALVERFIEKPQFGLLGMERVNVLLLNVALNELF